MRKTLIHRLPLGPHSLDDAVLELPRDLTAEEAERVCRLVRALSAPAARPGGETPSSTRALALLPPVGSS
jgi:hypothetical protein